MPPLTRRALRRKGYWFESVFAARALRVRHRAIEIEQWVVGMGRRVRADGGCLVLDDGERTEEHGLRAHDGVCVADGALVPAGAILYERHGYRDLRVATHPEGEEAVARYRGFVLDKTFRSEIDPRNGLESYVVQHPPGWEGEAPAIELVPRAEGAAWAPVLVPLPDGARILVTQNAVFRRGDLLAVVGDPLCEDAPETSGDARLHELLDGRSPHPHRAILAPVSGRVTDEGVPAGSLGIVRDGVTTRVKLPRRPRARIVFDGMWVNAGDPLTDGAIHHRDLAPLIGRQAFIEHLSDELDELFAWQGVDMPGPYSELVAAALLEGDRFVGLRRRRPR